LKEWTTPGSRNTPSNTNLEEEEIVDAPGNDGNASMPEQLKRPNPWRKMMMMIMMMMKEVSNLDTNWYGSIILHKVAQLQILGK